MFELILLIVILYVVLKRKSTIFMEYKLNSLFNINNFSNILVQNSINGIKLITANSRGENHLFALINNASQLSTSDISNVYEFAQKSHLHNIIIVVNSKSFSSTTLKKINEYKIQIWDNQKLNSLITTPETISILQTSNTSDDKCKIETNQPDPIQEYHSFFKDLFKKPNRL